jgi:hypothetical protein
LPCATTQEVRGSEGWTVVLEGATWGGPLGVVVAPDVVDTLGLGATGPPVALPFWMNE